MKLKNKMKTSMLTIILIIFSSTVVLANQQPKSFEAELEKVKTKLEKNNSKLEGVDREINALLIQICDLDVQIAKIDSQNEKIDVKAEETKKEIVVNNEKITKLDEIVKTDTLYYEQRLRNIYENGAVNFLDIMFTSKNFIEYIKKYNILVAIIEEDKRTYVNINTKQEQVEKAKKNIEIKNLQLDQLKEEKQATTNELVKQRDIRKRYIDDLEANKEKLAIQNKLLVKQEDELNAEITNELLKLLAEVRRNDPTIIAGTPNAAGFTWPVPAGGVVTAGFPTYPATFGGGKHDGLDIAPTATMSRAVVACKGGKVIKAVTDRPQNTYPYSMQYGNHIVLLHEDGVTTSLYGHLASANVQLGDTVTVGQQIGLIGSSGYSTGAHLHFEIRINGIAQNPLSYITKP